MSIAALSPACLAQAAPAPGSGGDVISSVSSVGSTAETLHVTVGHSFFLDTKSRLRRVYVADPAILDSITLSPTQIIVTAMAPGVTTLVLMNEAGQAQSYVVSSDLDVEGLRVAMSHAMRSEAVSVQGSSSRVILTGNVDSDALSQTATKLATLYSKDVANAIIVTPSHVKQVRLQVRILEVDRSKLAQFGVNLFNPGGNTSFLASATTSQFPSTSTLTSGAGNLPSGQLTTSNPLNFLLYSTKLNLGATIQDLETKQVLQILAEPTITTISGVKAEFLSGGEFPFPVVQPGGGAGTTAVVTIQFRPYGVKVEFTPTVNEDGTIRLKVSPEVSALDYTNAVTISGSTVPALSTRRADTEVELRSDQSFAISGLLDQRTTDLLSKTPGIASIPILGALFKSKNINHSTTELVVVVTPTVVDPLTETGQPGEPAIPIPTLNTGTFDDSLGKRHNPQPAAPPIAPVPPFSSNLAPAAGEVQSAAQTQTPASVQVSSAPVPANLPAAMAPPAVAPAQPPSIAPAAASQPTAPVALVKTPAASITASPAVVPVAMTPVSAATAPSMIAPMQASSSAPAAAPSRSSNVVPLVRASAVSNAVPPAAPASPSVQQSSLVTPATVPPASGKTDVATHAAPRSMVQIMALSNSQDADAMVAALKRHGYNVAVAHDPQDSLLHLEVGPFSSKSDAEAMRQRLLLEGYNATVK